MYIRISHIVSKIPLYYLDSLFPLQNELNFFYCFFYFAAICGPQSFRNQISSRFSRSFFPFSWNENKMEKFCYPEKKNSSAMSQIFYSWRFILIWPSISKRPIKFLLLDMSIAVEILSSVWSGWKHSLLYCIWVYFFMRTRMLMIVFLLSLYAQFYCHFILFHLFVCVAPFKRFFNFSRK